MTKKTKKGNLIHGVIGDSMDQVLNAEERTVTGTSTTDPKALEPSGLRFRDQVLGKTPSEHDSHFNIPNIIHKKGEKKK